MLYNIIQKTILSNCSFFENGAKYSEIKPKDIDNDLFNYHLQHLVEKKFLYKNNKIYFLTEKGKSVVTNIDEATKIINQNYKVSVYMCAVKGDEVLLHKRLKLPQYGYIGLPSGKIKFGENILDTAKREFREETNLDGEFSIIGNLRQIRKNKEGVVIEDGIFYICFTQNFKGDLLKRHKEGENFWCKFDKISQLDKIFKPSVEVIVAEIKKRISGEIPWYSKFIYEFEPEPEVY